MLSNNHSIFSGHPRLSNIHRARKAKDRDGPRRRLRPQAIRTHTLRFRCLSLFCESGPPFLLSCYLFVVYCTTIISFLCKLISSELKLKVKRSTIRPVGYRSATRRKIAQNMQFYSEGSGEVCVTLCPRPAWHLSTHRVKWGAKSDSLA